LANAILYSSLIDQTVALPLDGAAYEKKLQQLIAESKFQKTVVEVIGEDFTKSFIAELSRREIPNCYVSLRHCRRSGREHRRSNPGHEGTGLETPRSAHG